MEDVICKKVTSMLSLYIDDKLNDEHKSFVEEHFKVCPQCFQKYKEIKSIIENLRLSYDKVLKQAEKVETISLFNIREYEKFYMNISSYIDEELSDEESINFRKYLLKSKSARNELKNAYNLRTNIQESIETLKNETKVDLAKKITGTLKENKRNESLGIKLYLKVAILTGLLIFSTSGIYLFLNQDKEEHKKDLWYHKRVIYVLKPESTRTTRKLIGEYLNFKP